MMINTEMLGVLLGISTGTWLLVNRVFMKAAVKSLVGYIHSHYLAGIVDSKGRRYSLASVQSLAVLLAVICVATVLYGLLWYVDIVGTIAFIVAGSQLLHRLEGYFNFKYQFVKPKPIMRG